jgi:hypothetical protein
MARQLRFHYPGAWYHLMARGKGGDAISGTDDDRRAFLHRLGQVCGSHGWKVHAWVLPGAWEANEKSSATTHWHFMRIGGSESAAACVETALLMILSSDRMPEFIPVRILVRPQVFLMAEFHQRIRL